jgi:hypothetical protein
MDYLQMIENHYVNQNYMNVLVALIYNKIFTKK